MSGAPRKRQQGSALIMVLLIVALLAGIGIPLLTLTRMGHTVAGSVRNHEEAFNAAEAGFETARLLIEDRLATGTWTGFEGHYLTQPTGIDTPFDSGGNPVSAYFRSRTDQELLSSFDANSDGTADVANLIAFHQTFATDGRGQAVLSVTYSVFLINDEAGGGTADPSDALLVSIGTVRAGIRILDSVRLEIVIAFQVQSPAP